MSTSAAASQPTDSQFERQMKMMHDMHQRMQSAKTPQERSALMGEHTKTMQDGMEMMRRMRGGMGMPGGGPSEGMLRRRMDMMEMMMEMMMDRQQSPATR